MPETPDYGTTGAGATNTGTIDTETMLFCNNCGGPVGPTDIFCGKCGTRQPNAPPPGSSTGPTPGTIPPSQPSVDSISPETASTLCYLPFLGWVASVYVLASERFRRERDARFHAFQGLYLFVAWLIVDRVIGPMFRYGFMPRIGTPLRLAVIGTAIFMMIKTSQRVKFQLPVIGELAEKSASEQN